MNVTIIGSGYVGLVSGACLADVGNQVLCMDVDINKVEKLQNGSIPIFEPGLEELVRSNTAVGRLSFTASLSDAVKFADILFIAVGTPQGENGSADLAHVLGVAKGVGELLSSPLVIVNKSTVPVGTAARVEKAVQAELDKRNIVVDFAVVSNPEFLKEGAAIEDFLKPDRIVIGTADEGPRARMRELYAPFNRSHDRLLFMDIASAELTKYAANAMLATKISFMNELANIAERVGADIETVRIGIGSDPRIGYDFIYPGCGYGGSCFPKDVTALAQTAALAGYYTRILKAVEEVNKSQKLSLVDKIVARYGEDLNGKKFSMWGLAFKPNTDDLREAASLDIIGGLNRRGAAISAYDPVAIPEAQKIFRGSNQVTFSTGLYDGLDGSDGLIVVTEWKQFRNPDYDRLRTLLREPVIFDGRNVFDPNVVCQHGLNYYSIGRAPLIIPTSS